MKEYFLVSVLNLPLVHFVEQLLVLAVLGGMVGKPSYPLSLPRASFYTLLFMISSRHFATLCEITNCICSSPIQFKGYFIHQLNGTPTSTAWCVCGSSGDSTPNYMSCGISTLQMALLSPFPHSPCINFSQVVGN